ncbi:Syntaxin-related protein KNOLLE [Acorus calamus]|uniref:Syntaxin-related protein KNOLLE n=1 Tax=Acorus calamus TaxID=4465 RepID=A0AAV9EU95_ACOCL|nr:Syntaxin-related protein KNOLLE [Acorus calamus]
MNDLMTKSFTSYVDLKKEALKDLEAGPDGDNAAELEMASRSADENLRHFFEEAGRVREEMDSIRETLGRLQEANEESKTVHKPEALKKVRARINSDILSILKTAKKIRDRLEGMDRANSANRRLSGCREGTPIDRTRTSVTNGMRRKLRELMMEFQGLRQRVVAEYKEAVGRRYFTVTGEQPDEAVMERIVSSSDGGGEELLRAAALMHGEGEGRMDVLAAVEEIQGRHDAARELERSLLELHQVFLDMAVLVEAQSDQLDDIQHHVFTTSHYVKDGAKELKGAKGYQRSSRKWMCIGIIIFLLIILIIIIPIFTSFANS